VASFLGTHCRYPEVMQHKKPTGMSKTLFDDIIFNTLHIHVTLVTTVQKTDWPSTHTHTHTTGTMTNFPLVQNKNKTKQKLNNWQRLAIATQQRAVIHGLSVWLHSLLQTPATAHGSSSRHHLQRQHVIIKLTSCRKVFMRKSLLKVKFCNFFKSECRHTGKLDRSFSVNNSCTKAIEDSRFCPCVKMFASTAKVHCVWRGYGWGMPGTVGGNEDRGGGLCIASHSDMSLAAVDWLTGFTSR